MPQKLHQDRVLETFFFIKNFILSSKGVQFRKERQKKESDHDSSGYKCKANQIIMKTMTENIF